MAKSECFYDGCGSIKKQAMTEANKCTVKDSIGEETLGCMLIAIRTIWTCVLTCSRVDEAPGPVNRSSWFGWDIS